MASISFHPGTTCDASVTRTATTGWVVHANSIARRYDGTFIAAGAAS
jgi:hypothetical protein